jgi:hypothetical protein
MTIEEVLDLFDSEADRQAFLSLCDQYQGAHQDPGGGAATTAGQAESAEALLDRVMNTVYSQVQAARLPIPSREEMRRLIENYFA